MADDDHNDSLDHLISGSPVGQINIGDINPLSYPSLVSEEPETKPESSASSRSPQLCKDRIYVGNLHTSVDECVWTGYICILLYCN